MKKVFATLSTLSLAAGLLFCSTAPTYAEESSTSVNSEMVSVSAATSTIVLPSGGEIAIPMNPIVAPATPVPLFSNGQTNEFAQMIGSKVQEGFEDFMPFRHENIKGKSGLTQITLNGETGEEIARRYPKAQRREGGVSIAWNKAGAPVRGYLVDTILISPRDGQANKVDHATLKYDVNRLLACDRDLYGLDVYVVSAKELTSFAFGNVHKAFGKSLAGIFNSFISGIVGDTGAVGGISPSISGNSGATSPTGIVSDMYFIIVRDDNGPVINLSKRAQDVILNEIARAMYNKQAAKTFAEQYQAMQ
jgi:hypothetical protein